MKNLLALVCLSLFVSVASAQEAEEPAADVAQSNPTTILLLVNESAPHQVIVYDNAGNWLTEVRSIKLTVDLLGSGIQAECTMWKGVLKPASPKKMNVPVKEIKSITAEKFAERLAELNEG